MQRDIVFDRRHYPAALCGNRWPDSQIVVVIKMRGSNHSKDIREYVITGKGLVILGPRQTDYLRLSSGLPERIGQLKEKAPEPKAKV